MTRAFRIGLALAGALLLAAPRVHAASVAGAQMRWWAFDDDRTMRDEIVYVAPGPFHVQLEYWDVPGGPSQFRPEFGVHVRDARRSSYSATWRHEHDDERFVLGIEQVLARGWVARGETGPLVFDDHTEWGWNAGADYYWGSYHFASATLVRDPRANDLWVVPLRVRLATERDDWVQFTVAPASRRSLGWAVDARWRFVRAGLERNRNFDFGTRDNVIVTAGIEVPLPGK